MSFQTQCSFIHIYRTRWTWS